MTDIYIADVMSVIIYIIYRKKIGIPMLISYISLYTYLFYLYGIKTMPMQCVACIYCFVLIVVTKDIIEQIINKKEEKLISN